LDLLSEAVGSARVGQAFVRRISDSGRWGMRFPAFTGVGFHVILRGSGWLATAAGDPVPLRSGDIVLASHGAEHGLSHAPRPLGELPRAATAEEPAAPRPRDQESAVIEFLCGAYILDHGQVHVLLRQLPSVIVVSPGHDRSPELRSLVGLLEADVAQRRPGTPVTRSALVDLLLVHALRLWQESAGMEAWPETGDAAIAVALQEIHRGPQVPWTVQQLSDLAGMSRTAFTRRFTASLGKPPMAYLTGWRLVTGARLLQETELPLAVIARQVGYSSEFAFASAFRREFGIAPGRFRRRAHEDGTKVSASVPWPARPDLGG